MIHSCSRNGTFPVNKKRSIARIRRLAVKKISFANRSRARNSTQTGRFFLLQKCNGNKQEDRVTERVSAALSFLMTEKYVTLHISVRKTRAIGAAAMSSYLGFVIGGYLLGSILFAYVLPKRPAISISGRCRDGNPGYTMRSRYGGTVSGICVLLLELFWKDFSRYGCASGLWVCNPRGLRR